MSSEGMDRPFVVAAFFSDGSGGNQLVGTGRGVNAAHALARLVSSYYVNGGKCPLVTTSVLEPTRDTLMQMLALLDAIDAADKAEAAKVVNLVPTPVPTQPGDNGAELPPERMAEVQPHGFHADPAISDASRCSFCGQLASDPIHDPPPAIA